jgi:ADP-ribose pyrophosphatase
MEILRFEILADEMVGQGGFLAIRRLRLVNVRQDGSRSAPYLVDFVERRSGLDAVVVVAWQRDADDRVRVLLRDGLRPPVALGRAAELVALPEPPHALHVRELVAGIIEPGEQGERSLFRRAAQELHEEAGLRVAAAAFRRLGGGVFPSVGILAERFFFVTVEIPAEALARAVAPPGDGSPYEEGSRTVWLELDEALAACARGEIEDCKTELGLRRLADQLEAGQAVKPLR